MLAIGVLATTVGAGVVAAAVVGAGAVAGVGAAAGVRARPEGGGGASPDDGAVAGARPETEGPGAMTVGTRVEIDSGGGWVEGGGGVAGGGSTLPPGAAPWHMQASDACRSFPLVLAHRLTRLDTMQTDMAWTG